MTDITRRAVLSPGGIYRYRLDRVWDEEGRRALFVILNPSTADATQEDPTLRRCLGFARGWGYGSMTVANLYASAPADLKRAADPIGPKCDHDLRPCADKASLIVAAWGMHAGPDRVEQVRRAFRPGTRLCG